MHTKRKDGIRQRSRSSLTTLGIAIGVYSVLIIAAIALSGRELLNEELNKMGLNCMTISASDKSLNKLSVEDLNYLQGLPEVSTAAPLLVNMGQVTTRGYVGDSVVCGIDKNTSQIVQIQMVYGRTFSSGELARGSRVCIVDESLAQSFYKRSNIVGKQITLRIGEREESFEVVGISGSNGGLLSNMVGDYVPSFVYLPYTTQMQLTGRQAIDQLCLLLKDDRRDYESFGDSVSAALSRRAGYSNLYRYSNLASQKDKLNSIFDIVTWVLLAIGSVSFVVSGLNIMTIMLAAVKERTREIGIKKAIGAGVSDIVVEFLCDALKLSFTGCASGMAAGLLTVQLAAMLLNLPVALPLGVLLLLCLFSVTIGVIFGVYPALLAGNLHPVEALRQE